MSLSNDYPSRFKLAQLVAKYPVRDAGIVSLEFAKALSALLQVVKKQRRPTAAEEQHGLFDRAFRD